MKSKSAEKSKKQNQASDTSSNLLADFADAFETHHLLVILNLLKASKFPPVTLFTGISGIGKRAAGRMAARALLCQSPEHECVGSSVKTGCLKCPSCLAIAANTQTFNLTEISAELEEEGSSTLKIDTMRDLKAQAGFGGKRVILITDADQMTPQAANSVLKLLEEPPSGWIFILTASDPTRLLQTIISRCHVVRLKPMAEEKIGILLKQPPLSLDEKTALLCAELSQGSLGRALKLSDPETWKQRPLILDLLKNPSIALHALVDWAASKDWNLELLINQLEQISADLVGWSVRGNQPYRWLNQDAVSLLESHAARLVQQTGGLNQARDFWIERTERLAQARRDLKAPLNRKVLVQDLLIPWMV